MKIEHSLIRATNIPEIVKMISKEYGIDENESLQRFYASKAGANYTDDKTGLYGQSVLYIFTMFKEENDRLGKHKSKKISNE